MKIAITALMFASIIFSQAISFSKSPDPNLVKKLADSKGATSLYVENKGQIGDQHGKPNNEVKYLILRPGLNIQIKANSFSYDAYTVDRFKRVERLEEPFSSKLDKQNDDSLVYHFSRVDIELVNANPAPLITHQGSSNDYLNFYTNITSQTQGEAGATGVRGYSNIVYHDIYPNIDLEWFLDKDGKPEYQFIINPGGDPSRIRLRYHGAEKTELISEAIHIHIKPGIIKEHIPLSYLKESKEKLQIVFAKVADNEYGFSVPTYVSNETLIIDPMPNRLWGTYYGGSDYDAGHDIATDASDNVYIGGLTQSTTDIASTGAYDVTYGGGQWDSYLAKFSSSGSRLWATYYGGSLSEVVSGITTDAFGNVYIAGYTFSTTDIASAGAYDVTFDGGPFDAYLAKFSSSGSRVWATYYGGIGEDGVDDLATDATGNVYLVGFTSSTTDIASTGAYDVTYGGGQCDVFLAKFSSSGSRVWATYFGGSDYDAGQNIATDASGNVFIGGRTTSSTDIISTGAYDVTYGGGFDVFLAKFSSSGSRLWATYYGGSDYDEGQDIATDASGNVYIGGRTTSTTEIASTGAYDVTYGGGTYDAFLAKFSSSGSRLWATYYGGSLNEEGFGIATDVTGNVYIAGYTQSSTDIASTGAYDVTFGGSIDAFLAKFSSSGSRLWATYYGGSGQDWLISITTDASDNVFIVGYTTSTTDIASTGAYDVTFGGGAFDVFLAKFEEGSLTQAQIASPTLPYNSFCQNESFTLSNTVTGTFISPNTFTAQLSDANGSFINPTSIGTVSSTTSGSINCRIPNAISAGTGYRIRIISTNPFIMGSDNGTNTVINALPQPSISGSTSACERSQTYAYTVPSVLGHTYQWTTPSKGIIIGSNTGNSVSIRWTTAGIDSVKVRQTNPLTNCFKDTTITVLIQTSPNPLITGNSTVCQQSQNNSYSVPNIPSHTYQWYAPTKGIINGSSTGNSIAVNWTESGLDSIRVRQINTQTGCFKDTLLQVVIHGLPLPVISGPKVICQGESNRMYSVLPVSGHENQWSSVRNGVIKSSKNGNSVIIDWINPGIDTLNVRQKNIQTGCIKDTSFIVTILPKPEAVISGDTTVCISSPLHSYEIKDTGDSYFWYPPILGDLMSGQTGKSVQVRWSKLGVDTLRISIKNLVTGCVRDSFLVVKIVNSIQPLIEAFGNQNFLCRGDSRGLECLTEGQSYQWKKDGKNIEGANGKSYLAFEAGEYSVKTKSGFCEGESDKITLIEYEVPKPSIIGTKEVNVGSLNVSYKVSDIGIKNTVWSISNNASIIGEHNKNEVLVQFYEPGIVFLVVKQESINECIGEDSLSIFVNSINDVNFKNATFDAINISPNPIGESDQLQLHFSEISNQDITIELLDILGSVHSSNTLQAGSESCIIPVQGLSSGLYMLRVHTNNTVFIQKVIVN
jgi:predicted SpoU family rRNA methylase